MSSYSSQQSSDSSLSTSDLETQTETSAQALGENQQNLTDGGAGLRALMAAGAWGNLAALDLLPGMDLEALDFMGNIAGLAAQLGIAGDHDEGTVTASAEAGAGSAVDDSLLRRAAEQARDKNPGAGLESATAENHLAALSDPNLTDEERAEIAEHYKLTPTDVTSLQAGNGGLTLKNEQSTPTLNSKGEVAATKSASSASVSVGEGVSVSASQSQTTADGATTSRKAGVGIVAKGDGEVGVSASVGGSTSPAGTENGVGMTVDRSLTNRGAAQSTTVERTGKDGRKVALLTKGGVKVWTTQQADGTYLLSCSVEAGGTLSGQSDKDKRAEASVKGGASLLYTHILTESEVARYLSDVEAALDGNVAKDGPTELGMIASLGLLNDQGTDPLLAVGDASAAAGLAAGDTLTLTTSAGGMVGGNTGGPLSVGGKGSADLTRVCKIERTTDPKTGAPRVAISVTFTDARTLEGSLGISPDSTDMGIAGAVDKQAKDLLEPDTKGGTGLTGMVGGSGKVTQKTSDGMGCRFLLDPAAEDYDAHYGEIVGALTRDQLDVVATHIEAESTSRTSLLGWLMEASLSFLGITLKSASSSEVSEAVTDSRTEGMSGTVTGKHTDAGSVEVLGSEVAGRSEEGAISSTIKGGAATVDLSMTDTERTMLQTVGEERGASEAGGVWSWLTGLVSKPKGEGITAALSEVKKAVSVLRLSDRDLETVIGRAGDRSGWLAVAEAQAAARELSPWMQLRGSLIYPAPAADHPDAALADRVLLSRLRSLARFAGETGQAGVQLLTGVAREWQGTGSQADVGALAMFPDSLSGERTAYYAFLGAVDEKAGEGRVPTLAADETHRLLLEGGRLEVAVEGCTAFASARAKMEMLDALTARMDRLHLAVLSADGECTGAGELQTQQREIARLEGLLGGCKREERTLLASVGWTPASQKETGVLGDRLDQVRDLYEHWLGQIRSLRGAYDALEQLVMDGVEGGDIGRFPHRSVSNAGEARCLELEPEAEGYFAARVAFNRGSMSPGLRPEDKALQQRLATY